MATCIVIGCGASSEGAKWTQLPSDNWRTQQRVFVLDGLVDQTPPPHPPLAPASAAKARLTTEEKRECARSARAIPSARTPRACPRWQPHKAIVTSVTGCAFERNR